MVTEAECRNGNILKTPFCSLLNTILFILVVTFVAVAVGFIAWHIYLDFQAQSSRRRITDEYYRSVEEDEYSRLLQDPRFAGPPSRDRSGTDDSSSPPPDVARTGSRWNHVRRMMGLPPPTPPPPTSSLSDSTCPSSSDAVYMGGTAGQRSQPRGGRINNTSYGSTQARSRRAEIDRRLDLGGPVVVIGDTQEGTIAQRRRSSSRTGIFDIEIDK
ncbi:hypothetical protein PMZ80_006268 [Knufia obscura]|uniref:Protein S-acyltransferase n=1 Tax=Knufia obscura TaxID=1635080 RepID=A0ABR0RK63_9EURO|nr:hypothetical protein PMZ80_006268 [Knufia obscura]